MPTVEAAYTKAHKQDCDGFLKVVTVLKELEAKETLPVTTTACFLAMLIENALYVDKAETEAWTKILEQIVKAEKTVRTALAQELFRAITAPLNPPRSLKARMLSVPLEVRVNEQHQVRQLIAYDEKVLKALRKKTKAYSFRGRNIAVVQRKIMDTLAPALGNATKAATYTARILQAWNPESAPDSAAHIRTNYHERKRLARSKAARRSSK